MASIYTQYPPLLPVGKLKYLINNLKDWSIAHGLAVRPAPTFISPDVDRDAVSAVTAPVTLFPSLFPKHCFTQAKKACLAYNELYSAIASDEDWLRSVVEELISVDDFIEGLWRIHLQVKSEGYAQRIQLGLFRSDYMVHMESGVLDATSTVKQVEFNTIASSFGGLSSRVSELHEHLESIGAYPEEVSKLIDDDALPDNTSIQGLSTGLSMAHTAYGRSITGHPTCVIFLVQDPERNVFDQRHLEYDLNTMYDVQTFRLPWDRVLEYTSLDASKALLYHPDNTDKPYEVTVVYFRAGYSPAEYASALSWEARLQIERSRAIKCPSVLLQLAGTKKVQQVLATPSSPHLSKFLPDETAAAAVESTFAPIYPLDKSAAGMHARGIAQNPRKAAAYVLKPQREGGGNNIYREAIPAFLKTIPESSWPAYILMEMIEPPAQSNFIFRNGEIAMGKVICELGIYGACLWEETDGVGAGKRRVIENFDAGYLLRTKSADSSEGGVAAGFGSVDSALLIDV